MLRLRIVWVHPPATLTETRKGRYCFSEGTIAIIHCFAQEEAIIFYLRSGVYMPPLAVNYQKSVYERWWIDLALKQYCRHRIDFDLCVDQNFTLLFYVHYLVDGRWPYFDWLHSNLCQVRKADSPWTTLRCFEPNLVVHCLSPLRFQKPPKIVATDFDLESLQPQPTLVTCSHFVKNNRSQFLPLL